jgi:hypothetical protein
MRTDKKLWRNRKAKKELARRLQSENPGLEVVHPNAAGTDVGSGAHYAAVRPDRDSQPVRRFECFTADLYRLAAASWALPKPSLPWLIAWPDSSIEC